MFFLAAMLSSLPSPAPFEDSLQQGWVFSQDAHFDGKNLLLEGDVRLSYALGKMVARKALFVKKEEAEVPFSELTLEQDVQISLKDGSIIQCNRALVDFSTLSGILTPLEGQSVKCCKQIDGSTALTIRGLLFKIQLDQALKEEDERKKYSVASLYAQDNVICDLSPHYTLYADKVHYSPEDLHFLRSGYLIATPKDSLSHCKLVHHTGELAASRIEADLRRSIVTMESPLGTGPSSLIFKHTDYPLQLSAGFLAWSVLDRTLDLKENVRIESAQLGILLAEGSIQIIQQKETDHPHNLQSIQAAQGAELHFQSHGKRGILSCPGSLFLDHMTQLVRCEGTEISGIKKQLVYTEDTLSLFADHATVAYTMEKGHLEPICCTLNGHVRLMDTSCASLSRYAIADHIDYDPKTRFFSLKADKGNRALFWDEKQHLSISATEIQGHFDPLINQHVIQGVGSVHFNFTLEEQKQFKKIFPKYVSTHF